MIVEDIDYTESFHEVMFNLSSCDSKRLFFERIKIIETVARGSQAYIKSAHDNILNWYVAVKIFKKYRMGFSSMEAAYLEKNIMAKLDCPYILKTLNCFEDSTYFCFVTELMHGDLRNYLSCL